jgi:hypothetical protein
MARDLNALGREELKKIVSFAVAGLVLALIAPSANARQVCNHDPSVRQNATAFPSNKCDRGRIKRGAPGAPEPAPCAATAG